MSNINTQDKAIIIIHCHRTLYATMPREGPVPQPHNCWKLIQPLSDVPFKVEPPVLVPDVDESQVFGDEDEREEQEQYDAMTTHWDRGQLIVAFLFYEGQRKKIGCPCQAHGKHLKERWGDPVN